MSNPASETYKELFGDPAALTPEQQKILDAIPVKPQEAGTAGASKLAEAALRQLWERIPGRIDLIADHMPLSMIHKAQKALDALAAAPAGVAAPRPLTQEEHQVLRAAVRDSAEVVHPGRLVDAPKGEPTPEPGEFALRLTEYGLAMRHGQGEKARVLAEVLESMAAREPSEDAKDAARVPMTPEQIDALLEKINFGYWTLTSNLIRAVEAFHDIGQSAKETGA